MKTSIKNLMLALGITVLASSCGGNGKFREPDDCVNGFGVTLSDMKTVAIDESGNKIFANKMIVNEYGDEFSGERLLFDKQISCCVNGFYRLGSYGKYYLMSTEQGKDNGLKQFGPFQTVGMFYEDVTPACVAQEGIGYINREGQVVFWLDKVIGAKGLEAYNFMGGLSIVGLFTENSPILIYGAIDTEGNTVIPFEYQKLMYAGSNLWYAESIKKNADKNYKDRIADIIDRNGNSIISFPAEDYAESTFAYDNGNNGPHNFAFNGEYGLLKKYWDKGFMIINRSGEILSENTPNIRCSSVHLDGKFCFYDKEKDMYGIMKPDGEIIIEAKHTTITLLSDKLFCAYDGEEYAVYDYSGELQYRLGRKRHSHVLNKCFYATDKHGLYIMSLDDPSESRCIKSGHALSYYDQLLLKPVISSKREIWMPELGPAGQAAQALCTRQSDKPIADVIGPVKNVSIRENGHQYGSYTFDEKGCITHLDGTPITSKNSTRDNSGRITQITLAMEDDFGEPMNHVIVFTYNKDNRIESRLESNDFADAKKNYIHDEMKEITGHTIDGVEGTITFTYEYEKYDKHFNWTRMIMTDSYGNKTRVTRNISYY